MLGIGGFRLFEGLLAVTLGPESESEFGEIFFFEKFWKEHELFLVFVSCSILHAMILDVGEI